MRQIFSFLLLSLLCASSAFATPYNDSLDFVNRIKLADSLETALVWKTGTILLAGGVAQLKLPEGFKFLDAAQSKYIIHDVWGNPEREDVLGMVFPKDGGPFADSSFAFVVSFEETGYVKDKDADEIDYKQMLKEMQDSEADASQERSKNGYEAIHILKWAQSPFYDKDHKVLHWAKEIKFGASDDHTLNYDVRVLGRRGILSLNAVASMSELALVKSNINQVLTMAAFTPGNTYNEFDSNSDKVAEYGIGALVAGGILAKTGVFAMIGKFLLAAWKFVAIGIVAIVAALKKFIGRKKDSSEVPPVQDYTA